jgi:undecaprenyl pyrophosphate synthase
MLRRRVEVEAVEVVQLSQEKSDNLKRRRKSTLVALTILTNQKRMEKLKSKAMSPKKLKLRVITITTVEKEVNHTVTVKGRNIID